MSRDQGERVAREFLFSKNCLWDKQWSEVIEMQEEALMKLNKERKELKVKIKKAERVLKSNRQILLERGDGKVGPGWN